MKNTIKETVKRWVSVDHIKDMIDFALDEHDLPVSLDSDSFEIEVAVIRDKFAQEIAEKTMQFLREKKEELLKDAREDLKIAAIDNFGVEDMIERIRLIKEL